MRERATPHLPPKAAQHVDEDENVEVKGSPDHRPSCSTSLLQADDSHIYMLSMGLEPLLSPGLLAHMLYVQCVFRPRRKNSAMLSDLALIKPCVPTTPGQTAHGWGQ